VHSAKIDEYCNLLKRENEKEQNRLQEFQCELLTSIKLIHMDFKTIKIQLGESMAWVNLDRPEVRNAMNPLMIHELTEIMGWLNSRDDIRVVILKGNGKCFCAGADLNYMKETANYHYNQNMDDANKLSDLFKAIYFCDKAVITAVHGAVMGGGVGIMSACDIVIAEAKTKFAFPEVKLGMTPATISPFVMMRCGQTITKELMLTGRAFTADEALNYHIVNAVVDEDKMIDKEREYIRYFLDAAPEAIKECKRLLRMVNGTDNRHDNLYLSTATAIAIQRASDAGQEGMAAFLRKGLQNGKAKKTIFFCAITIFES
jgi:Enoyl-CoA hydratase/carnithine racemase